MSQVIWKFKLEPGSTSIEVPHIHQVLAVQAQVADHWTQEENIYVWILLDQDRPFVDTLFFETIPTGLPCDTLNKKYVGTVQLSNGMLVFHVFYR